jgi:serine/threonine-protein kinase
VLRSALAECYAQLGRTASAWAQFREAAAAAGDAGQAELAAQARARAKALEPELSYLTVSTWKGQQVLVTSDESPLDETVLGSAIPLDPGRHVIAASAPGKRAWSTAIMLGGHADHITVAVPVLPDDIDLLHDELRAPPVATASPAETTGGSDGSVQRTLGLVAGAIGIAGVATGAVFGIKAASDWSDAKAQCRPYPYCGSEGARLAQDAQTSAMISNISFATGIAGLTGGALLWFTARDDEQKAPELGVGVGRVMLRGPL